MEISIHRERDMDSGHSTLDFFKTALATVLFVGGTFFALQCFGIFGISYLRPVDNVPFENAATVVDINERSLTLDDGRQIQFRGPVDDVLRASVEESQNLVGIGEETDGRFTLYGRRHRTICGLGLPMFTLRLIPINVPRYQRCELMWGCLMTDHER